MTIHKTTITVTILHPEDVPFPGSYTLEHIAAEIDQGAWLGSWEVVNVQPVPDEQVPQECRALGNDGDFFEDY